MQETYVFSPQLLNSSGGIFDLIDKQFILVRVLFVASTGLLRIAVHCFSNSFNDSSMHLQTFNAGFQNLQLCPLAKQVLVDQILRAWAYTFNQRIEFNE